MAGRRGGRRTDSTRGKPWPKSYREFLEEKCRALLDQDPFLPYPPPTLEVTCRLAERGQPCSLCGNPIPTDAEVDPKPQEYVFPSGAVMRLHGLMYTGAADGRTSCITVWQDMSERRNRGA